MTVLLEVCTDSVAGVRSAAEGGAQRVELCCALALGGLTPSAGLIAEAMAAAPAYMPVHVLVRPRGGDFVYSEEEMSIMAVDIRQAKQLGAAGVVVGVLMPDGTVDEARTRRLFSVARNEGLDFTFHRAFDMCRDLSAALEQLILLGIPRVLTSGGEASASQGAATISALVAQSAGRITVMAGAGVSENNVAALVAQTGVREIHGSARRKQESSMAYRRPGMSMSSGSQEDYAHMCTDAASVKAILQAARQAATQPALS